MKLIKNCFTPGHIKFVSSVVYELGILSTTSVINYISSRNLHSITVRFFRGILVSNIFNLITKDRFWFSVISVLKLITKTIIFLCKSYWDWWIQIPTWMYRKCVSYCKKKTTNNYVGDVKLCVENEIFSWVNASWYDINTISWMQGQNYTTVTILVKRRLVATLITYLPSIRLFKLHVFCFYRHLFIWSTLISVAN